MLKTVREQVRQALGRVATPIAGIVDAQLIFGLPSPSAPRLSEQA